MSAVDDTILYSEDELYTQEEFDNFIKENTFTRDEILAICDENIKKIMTPDDFFDELDKLFGNEDGYVKHLEMIKKLKEENEKLKEEIQVLNQEVNDRVVIEDIADLFGSDEGDEFDWENAINEKIQENHKLKEQNAKIKNILKM